MFPIWILGFIIGIVSISIKVLGTILQKISHKKEDNKHYIFNIVWISGVLMSLGGSILDLVALAFAPQTLIASLGGLTIVVNVLFARLLLNEILILQQYITTFIIFLGTTITVIYSPKVESNNNYDTIKGHYESLTFLIYITLVIFILIICRIIIYIFRKKEINKTIIGILIPITSGIIAAQNMFFGKTFTTLIRFSIENDNEIVYEDYLFYCSFMFMLLATFLYLKWLNQGLKNYQATLIVPINKSLWIIVSILSAILVLGENFQKVKEQSNDDSDDNNDFNDTDGNRILFIIGVTIIIIGLIKHSYLEKKETTEKEIEEEYQEDENIEEVISSSIININT